MCDFGSKKLTLNHSSFVNDGEETRILVTPHKREKGLLLNFFLKLIHYSFFKYFFLILSMHI